MSEEAAPPMPGWARRVAVVAASLVSLVVLGLVYMSWGFAPRWGFARLPGATENAALNAQLAEASSRASTLGTSITAVAAVLVLVTMVLLMIWPIRRGYLLVAAVTPVALVIVWVATSADLAFIAAPF